MKQRFQVTYSYKAVITVDVRTQNEEDAKKMADVQIQKIRSSVNRHANLEDDTWTSGGNGILNMTKTWGAL